MKYVYAIAILFNVFTLFVGAIYNDVALIAFSAICGLLCIIGYYK